MFLQLAIVASSQAQTEVASLMATGPGPVPPVTAATDAAPSIAPEASIVAYAPALPARRWRDGKYLTGDWGGLRSTLAGLGIEPFVYWTGISSGNPRGGAKQGHMTAVDDFYMGVNLDLSKWIGWQGASLTVSGVNRDGRGLTNNYIQSQYNSQQTVGGQSLFFYQLCLQQKLDDGKITLKAGRFSASDDLNASPLYSFYLNNGIDGDIRNVLFDTQSSAYPFATWAGLAKYNPNGRFNVQAAVYQTWANIFNSTTNGMDWSVHPGDGVIFMEQVGWTPTPRKELPGHYWVGGTYSPWKGFSQFGRPDKVAGSYGFYAHADQMVYRKGPGSDGGLALWMAAAYYPQQNISIVPFQWNGGAIYQGLIRRRKDDRAILGLIYGRFSRDYAKTAITAGKGNPLHELALEAGYRFQLSKFTFFQPDLQWVSRPSGTGRIPNAIVAGAEIGVTF